MENTEIMAMENEIMETVERENSAIGTGVAMVIGAGIMFVLGIGAKFAIDRWKNSRKDNPVEEAVEDVSEN